MQLNHKQPVQGFPNLTLCRGSHSQMGSSHIKTKHFFLWAQKILQQLILGIPVQSKTNKINPKQRTWFLMFQQSEVMREGESRLWGSCDCCHRRPVISVNELFSSHWQWFQFHSISTDSWLELHQMSGITANDENMSEMSNLPSQDRKVGRFLKKCP